MEKPFPRIDFITLVQALLPPEGNGEGEQDQGTFSNLRIANIIHLNCISGATSTLELAGPKSDKA